jgi:hypothetical protein
MVWTRSDDPHSSPPGETRRSKGGSALIPSAVMRAEISSGERGAYYRAALRLLRFVEGRAPSGRRFGKDADALWKSFAGGLKTSDRIDILLRDADAAWPGAFGARAAFGLRAVAEDDAFGAQWVSLDPMEGEKVWRAATKEADLKSTDEVIAAIEKAWDVELGDVKLPKLGPTTKLVLAGRSAVAAAIAAFAGEDTLSWPEQVVVVADEPSERQLAAAAAAILNITKPTQLRATDEVEARELKGFQAVVSDDASDEVRTAIGAVAS